MAPQPAQSNTGPARRGRILLIAPLCRDEIVRGEARTTRAGGAALYMARALTRLGAEVRLHAPLADRDRDLLEALPANVEVVIHPARETTRFLLVLDENDPDRRALRCLAEGGTVDAARIDLDGADIVLLGPLLPGDLPGDLCAALRAARVPIDLGVQGLVRSIAPDGSVRLARRVHRAELPPIRILAGDDGEISRIRGVRARETVITRASRGAVVQIEELDQDVVIPAAPLRRAPGEAVGLGDTFLAVYSWWRWIGLDVAEAGARAAEAAADRLVAELD